MKRGAQIRALEHGEGKDWGPARQRPVLAPPKWSLPLTQAYFKTVGGNDIEQDKDLLLLLRGPRTVDDAYRAIRYTYYKYRYSFAIPDDVAEAAVSALRWGFAKEEAGERCEDGNLFIESAGSFLHTTLHPLIETYFRERRILSESNYLVDTWYLPFAAHCIDLRQLRLRNPLDDLYDPTMRLLAEFARASLSLEGDLQPKALAAAINTTMLTPDTRAFLALLALRPRGFEYTSVPPTGDTWAFLALLALQPWAPAVQEASLGVGARFFPQAPVVGAQAWDLILQRRVPLNKSTDLELWRALALVGANCPEDPSRVASIISQAREDQALLVAATNNDAKALETLLKRQGRMSSVERILAELKQVVLAGVHLAPSILDIIHSLFIGTFRFVQDKDWVPREELESFAWDLRHRTLAAEILELHGDRRARDYADKEFNNAIMNNRLFRPYYPGLISTWAHLPPEWIPLNLATRFVLRDGTNEERETPAYIHVMQTLGEAGVDVLDLADTWSSRFKYSWVSAKARWKVTWPVRRALWAGHLFAPGGPAGWLGEAALAGDYAGALAAYPGVVAQLDALKGAAAALAFTRQSLSDRGVPVATAHEVIQDPAYFAAWYLEAIPDVFGGGVAVHVADPGRPAWAEALRAKYAARVARRRRWAFLSVDPRAKWRTPIEQFLAKTPLRELSRDILLASGGWPDRVKSIISQREPS